MPTSAINTWLAANRLDPLYHAEDADQQDVKLAANLTLAKGTILGELTGVNAVQTVSITGAPTGGTFTLSFNGATTAAIAYNATAAQVQSALEALSTIGSGNVAGTGGALPSTAVVITFQNALGNMPVAALTHTDSFTGGTSPAAAIAQTTTGTVGTKGTFTTYKYSNTDGSQVARAILVYGVTTDASGNITMTGEWSQTLSVAPVYMAGYFRTQDLVGLDQNAVENLSGAILEGTVNNGVFRF